jgi:hypothetical protein
MPVADRTGLQTRLRQEKHQEKIVSPKIAACGTDRMVNEEASPPGEGESNANC